MVRKLNPWPDTRPLRQWQLEALCTLTGLKKQEALVLATPGGGKTFLGLRLAHDLLSRNIVERVVVVVPNTHMRWLWHDAAKEVGLEYDCQWSNCDGVEAPDYHGVVVTYQQNASQPDLFRFNTRVPTLLIADECHHIGDEKTWGEAMKHAFAFARYKLLLSGTAFRTDNSPIPWVTYVEGRSRADYEYGYSQALADGVCCDVRFPTFDGRVRWRGRSGRCEERWLTEALPPGTASECLRAALDLKGNWLPDVIRQAHLDLMEMRAEGHRDAAGIIFALDQEHARRIGEFIRRKVCSDVVVAVSDDAESSAKISRFARSDARWIVTVRMVSEGADIPRLRVGVYATNYSSELFFRQVAGRLVRVVEGVEEQSASLYIPAVEPLVRYALAIKTEREHVLRPSYFQPPPDIGGVGEDVERPQHIFVPLSSEAQPHEVIYDGGRFGHEELRSAAAVGQEMGLKAPVEQVAALLRRGAAMGGVHILRPTQGREENPTPDPGCGIYPETSAPAVQERSGPSNLSLFERKRELRQECSMLSNKLAGLTGERPFRIHKEWKEKGGSSQKHATEEELLSKREWLLARVDEEYRHRVSRLPKAV